MVTQFIMIEKDELMSVSDDELMKGVRQGNIVAFTELFNKYKSEVVNFIYRQCGDYGKAEDITQECFLRIYHNAGTYKNKGKFRNWVLTIALNLTRTVLVKKSEKSKTLSLDREIADKAPGLEKTIEKREVETIIQEALNKLPAEQREILVLRHYHDLKFSEIAEILNCPVETVKSRMKYGLLKLYELLKGSGYEY